MSSSSSRRGTYGRRCSPLLVVAACVALTAVLRATGAAFVSCAREGVRAVKPRVGLRASIMEPETKIDARQQPKQKFKYPSQLTGLSAQEIEARKAKAIDIFEGMKPDIQAEMARYQTFRPDKLETFLKEDGRGQALLELYKPGTPEYADFFEEVMGPFLLDVAKEKLTEGLWQTVGVIGVVGGVAAIIAFFGTDIIQALTSPFTGFAEQFVELYGF
eukprot:TRINITY_DN43499_c0_g1_i1.p1 TRINITY_DN43499_c0_g1~~TRINITY_DN43499_c0_g1_i1.p1  ORF type:complete len:217 (-),score=50.86 TRINITY_DN43499_c0_g1_i1:205-855(-)